MIPYDIKRQLFIFKVYCELTALICETYVIYIMYYDNTMSYITSHTYFTLYMMRTFNELVCIL